MLLLCRYISNSASYPDVSFAAMDVDYNSKVDIIDALFLQFTIARKYRFLDDSSESGPKMVQNGCDFLFSARLLTDGGLAVVNGATTSVLVQVCFCVAQWMPRKHCSPATTFSSHFCNVTFLQIGGWSESSLVVDTAAGGAVVEDHADGVVLQLAAPDENGVFSVAFTLSQGLPQLFGAEPGIKLMTNR